jgi:hypothetical protein
MSRFASILAGAKAPDPGKESGVPTPQQTPGPSGRAGKKAVSGYFSRDVSRGLHLLALERDTNLQALMGEAFDDLMRKYGKHPSGNDETARQA